MIHINDSELISIIMPAYNSANHIKQAINSVLDQSYKHWELIVIDDGSRDSTKSVIELEEKKDPRIRLYVNSNNKGVSETRNKGVNLAKGKWIAFLDSDDMWHPEKLEQQLKLAYHKGAQFIFTGASYIDVNGKAFSGVFNVPAMVNYDDLKKHNVISCSSVLIEKELMNHVKMEGDEMHEDYAAWLKILKMGVCAYGINQPLLIYRISSESKSGNKIKSIKMTYNVFRFLKNSPIISIFYTISHTMAAYKKYKKINMI
ncbi:glycosyltransferase family 2 protein [Exiguobacterium chiriqhucha]|uniref:glycosyltransferase family 2 protein n=1 Tax=Exiguobacterium chiriqhucha TaxID=1385984 RepID=UPI0038BC7CA7